MDKVTVSLSGGEVISLSAPADLEVEVRQYHIEHSNPDPERRVEDPAGGTYEVIHRVGAPPGQETVELVAQALRFTALERHWEPSGLDPDYNGPPMDTTDYEGRALAFLMKDIDGCEIRVLVEDVTPDDERRF